MKNILFLILVCTSVVACGQKSIKNAHTPELKTNQYLAKRDSILKETEFGSVYITKDTTAKMYSRLSPKGFDTITFNNLFDSEFLNDFLNSNKTQIKHFENIPILGDWCSLYVLNNRFYVYSPSDWMFNKRMLVTDSVFYHMASDDWGFKSIQQFKKEMNGDLVFELVGYNSEQLTLTIKFIDENITFWQYKSMYGDEVNELRVKSSHVKDFDMIVNDCLGSKCYQEFIFEMPEYSETLKRYGNSR